MGAVAGGVYYNTESGLTPLLDRLTAGLDQRAASDAQLAGLAPALRSQGIPVSAPSGGLFSNILGALGTGGQNAGQPTSRTPAGSTPGTPMPIASSEPATKPTLQPGGDGLPVFAGAPTAVNGNEIARYYGEGAQKRGIDPMTTMRVIGSEGGFSPNRAGDGNSSFGPLQLHYGGVAGGGNSVPGLGDDFTRATGLDARDPKNWKAAADFTLDHIAKNGWGAFHGAAKVGVGNWDGISRNGALVQSAGLDTNPTASTPASAPKSGGGLQLPGRMTTDDLGAMIANPASRSIGLQLWQQGLTGKNFGFTATPGGDVIRTDPRTGEAQLVYRAPVKREHVEMNGRALSFDPQSGTYADATPAGMPANARPPTAAERDAYGVQPGSPLFIKGDGTPSGIGGGVNNTVNNGADPLMAAVGDRFKDSMKNADAAVKTMTAIRTSRSQLDKGIIAGALADEKLALQKLASSLGLPGVDTSRITNTESFNATVGPIVLGIVKNLGSGSSISNADLGFAERMAGSNKLDAPSIQRLFDIQERAAQSTIDRHNALVEQLQKSPAGAAAYRTVGGAMRVEAPAGAASQAHPAAPQAGAVIQGYRFKGGDPSAQSSWELAQ